MEEILGLCELREVGRTADPRAEEGGGRSHCGEEGKLKSMSQGTLIVRNAREMEPGDVGEAYDVIFKCHLPCWNAAPEHVRSAQWGTSGTHVSADAKGKRQEALV